MSEDEQLVTEGIARGVIWALDSDLTALEDRIRQGCAPSEERCGELLNLAARIESVVKIARGEEMAE